MGSWCRGLHGPRGTRLSQCLSHRRTKHFQPRRQQSGHEGGPGCIHHEMSTLEGGNGRRRHRDQPGSNGRIPKVARQKDEADDLAGFSRQLVQTRDRKNNQSMAHISAKLCAHLARSSTGFLSGCRKCSREMTKKRSSRWARHLKRCSDTQLARFLSTDLLGHIECFPGGGCHTISISSMLRTATIPPDAVLPSLFAVGRSVAARSRSGRRRVPRGGSDHDVLARVLRSLLDSAEHTVIHEEETPHGAVHGRHGAGGLDGHSASVLGGGGTCFGGTRILGPTPGRSNSGPRSRAGPRAPQDPTFGLDLFDSSSPSSPSPLRSADAEVNRLSCSHHLPLARRRHEGFTHNSTRSDAA